MMYYAVCKYVNKVNTCKIDIFSSVLFNFCYRSWLLSFTSNNVLRVLICKVLDGLLISENEARSHHLGTLAIIPKF